MKTIQTRREKKRGRRGRAADRGEGVEKGLMLALAAVVLLTFRGIRRVRVLAIAMAFSVELMSTCHVQTKF